ncbi:MAG: ABC transporter substrate-binding protein [Armatimonadetes bacterium]|nr:ABC transporter substrate-binding protein [Armatimonadota bacterium]
MSPCGPARNPASRRIVPFVVMLALLAGLGAAGARAAAAPAGQELMIRVVRDVLNMDPAHITTTEDHSLAFVVYSGLVKLKTGSISEIEPDLAIRWEISPDGRVYTFQLRRGVKWQKGYGTFTAADVKYSIERIMDRRTGSRFRGDYALVDRVETDGDYAVRIHLRQPFPAFLTSVLAYRPGLIVNQRAVTEKGEAYVSDPIGTGPFVFERRVPGQRMVLARNPDYYGNAGRLARVTFKIIMPDPLAEIALRTGEAQLAYIDDPEIQRRVMRQQNLRHEIIDSIRTYMIYVHLGKKPWSDVRVRQALMYALDRQAIATHVMRGMAKPANSILNPNVFGYSAEDAYRHDPQRARALLAEAGVRGARAELYTANIIKLPDMAAVIKENFKAVGVEMGINIFEFALWMQQTRGERHDLSLTANARIDADQYYFPLLHSSARPYPNASHYMAIDREIEAARVAVNPAARRDLYARIHRKLLEDVPMLPVVYPRFVMAMRPEVQGAKMGPTITYNLADISIKQ